MLLANAMENGGRCQAGTDVRCQRHGRACPGVCTGMAQELHHPQGKAAGDHVRNRQAVCRACNLHIGDPLATNPQAKPVTRW